MASANTSASSGSVADLVHQTWRTDRHGVPALLRLLPVARAGGLGALADLLGALRRDAGLLRCPLAAHLVGQLSERGLGIGEKREIGRHVLADLPGIDVDLHDLGAGRHGALHLREDELEHRCADDEQQIATLERCPQRRGRDEVQRALVEGMAGGHGELRGIALEGG